MTSVATGPFDLTANFVRLRSGGSMDVEPLSPSFWRGDSPTGDMVVTAFDFASSEDLHSSMQEIHPDGDELIVMLAGAIDLIAESNDGDVIVHLDAGQAAVMHRDVWHRLAMRAPGRLLSINVRSGLRGRNLDDARTP